MNTNGTSGQPPTQVAKHFLHLLDDVYRIHGIFLEEICALRARVQELETANAALAAGERAADDLAPMPDVKGCAVYLVALDGRIQGWSGGAGELYGYSVEEVIGQPMEFLRAPLAAGAQPRDCQDPLQPLPSPRLRKDGGTFEVYPHCTILLDEKGQAASQMHVEVPIQHPGSPLVTGGGKP